MVPASANAAIFLKKTFAFISNLLLISILPKIYSFLFIIIIITLEGHTTVTRRKFLETDFLICYRYDQKRHKNRKRTNYDLICTFPICLLFHVFSHKTGSRLCQNPKDLKFLRIIAFRHDNNCSLTVSVADDRRQYGPLMVTRPRFCD